MPDEIVAIEGLDELDEALAASWRRPLLLFKHSVSCGTSAEAFDELLFHVNDRDGAQPDDVDGVRYAMVTVQTHRDVSNAVSTRLGVRHETPQVLLILDGQVVWSASHFRVTADAVARAIASLGQKTV